MVEALELLDVPTPRLNPDLKGQAEAEREFLQAFGTGQMHHAWLISGPRGVGKATFAYRVARYVLAQKTLIEEDSAQTLDLVYNHHTEISNASDAADKLRFEIVCISENQSTEKEIGPKEQFRSSRTWTSSHSPLNSQ